MPAPQMLEHVESKHPRAADGKPYPFWRTSPGDLGEELGLGIALYFRSLTWLTLTMLVMWVLHIPQQLFTLSAAQYASTYQKAKEEGSTALFESIFADTSLSSLALGGLAQQDEPGALRCAR